MAYRERCGSVCFESTSALRGRLLARTFHRSLLRCHNQHLRLRMRPLKRTTTPVLRALLCSSLSPPNLLLRLLSRVRPTLELPLPYPTCPLLARASRSRSNHRANAVLRKGNAATRSLLRRLSASPNLQTDFFVASERPPAPL